MCRNSLKGEYPSTASRQVTEAMRVATPGCARLGLLGDPVGSLRRTDPNRI